MMMTPKAMTGWWTKAKVMFSVNKETDLERSVGSILGEKMSAEGADTDMNKWTRCLLLYGTVNVETLFVNAFFHFSLSLLL